MARVTLADSPINGILVTAASHEVGSTVSEAVVLVQAAFVTAGSGEPTPYFALRHLQEIGFSIKDTIVAGVKTRMVNVVAV